MSIPTVGIKFNKNQQILHHHSWKVYTAETENLPAAFNKMLMAEIKLPLKDNPLT
jgi:tRNA A37 threonylcarbamoyladenosine modification protein TsaB